MKHKHGFIYNEATDPGAGTPPAGGGTPPAATPPAAGEQTPPTGSLLAGQQTAAWYDPLPADLKAHPYVAQTPDLAAFVKSAVDTKSLVGANTVRVPGEKATDAERAEFYTKLGRPADHTGYVPKVAPVEGTVDPAVSERMTKKFHELGLSAAQGSAILEEYYGVLNDGFTQHNDSIQARRNEATTLLKNEWGQNFEANVKTAQLAVRELGGKTLLEKLESNGLGDDPDIIKFLHNVGSKLLDDVALGGGENRFTGSVEGAVAEISRLKQDADFMRVWGDAQAPGHKEAVDRWLALHRTAFPGKQADQS